MRVAQQSLACVDSGKKMAALQVGYGETSCNSDELGNRRPENANVRNVSNVKFCCQELRWGGLRICESRVSLMDGEWWVCLIHIDRNNRIIDLVKPMLVVLAVAVVRLTCRPTIVNRCKVRRE